MSVVTLFFCVRLSNTTCLQIYIIILLYQHSFYKQDFNIIANTLLLLALHFFLINHLKTNTLYLIISFYVKVHTKKPHKKLIYRVLQNLKKHTRLNSIGFTDKARRMKNKTLPANLLEKQLKSSDFVIVYLYC